MKKIRLTAAALMVWAAIGFTSCNTDDPVPLAPEDQTTNPDNPEEASTIFSANLSGQEYTANNAVAVVENGHINIVAQRGAVGEYILITVMGTTPGTYTGNQVMVSYSDNVAADFEFSGNVPPEEVPGFENTVVITDIDTAANRISGTFELTAYWTDFTDENPPSPIEFTAGTFENVPYGNAIQVPAQQVIAGYMNGFMVQYNTDITATTGNGNNISFQGNFGDDSLKFNLNGITQPGIYTIGSDPGEITVTWTANGEIITAEKGTVVITSNTGGWLQGIFFFGGRDMNQNAVSAGNGTFAVQII